MKIRRCDGPGCPNQLIGAMIGWRLSQTTDGVGVLPGEPETDFCCAKCLVAYLSVVHPYLFEEKAPVGDKVTDEEVREVFGLKP